MAIGILLNAAESIAEVFGGIRYVLSNYIVIETIPKPVPTSMNW